MELTYLEAIEAAKELPVPEGHTLLPFKNDFDLVPVLRRVDDLWVYTCYYLTAARDSVTRGDTPLGKVKGYGA